MMDLIDEEYQEIGKQIAFYLFKEDPICINFTYNEDEYEPEAATIVVRLSKLEAPVSVHEVLDVVHEEFKNWFNSDTLVGPRMKYLDIAVYIKEMWNEFKEKQQISRNQ